ncbi:MAG TPA: inositol monophosphatase family protein [Acidimicrobiales bacterium]|nr:inositol monophosphatase family protein [Acidimicrobiales bacterium]
MDGPALLELCRDVADAIHAALVELDDWSLAGTRPGQYRSDLAADEVAVEMLTSAGLGVLSEESGAHLSERALLAIVDPVDGSTNASRGIPWFATSIAVLDSEGPLAGFVVNQAIGTTYEAVRGEGARRDGKAIAPSGKRALEDSIIGISGFPVEYLGWRQFRALGAVALDLCCVADGTLDAYLDCSKSAHGGWDYLAGMLVCTEAGASFGDTEGRDPVVRTHLERRSPLAAATPELLGEVIAAFSSAREGHRGGR